jgi:hypothetical protein
MYDESFPITRRVILRFPRFVVNLCSPASFTNAQLGLHFWKTAKTEAIPFSAVLIIFVAFVQIYVR